MDVDWEEVFLCAAKHGQLTVVAYLVAAGHGRTAAFSGAFVAACKSGHLHIAKYLIDVGADPFARPSVDSELIGEHRNFTPEMRQFISNAREFGLKKIIIFALAEPGIKNESRSLLMLK